MSKKNTKAPNQEKPFKDKKHDKSNKPPIEPGDFGSNTKEPGVHSDSAPIGGG